METRAARAASSSRAQRALDVRTCKLTVYEGGVAGWSTRPITSSRDQDHVQRSPITTPRPRALSPSAAHTHCSALRRTLYAPHRLSVPISDGRALRADLRRASSACRSPTGEERRCEQHGGAQDKCTHEHSPSFVRSAQRRRLPLRAACSLRRGLCGIRSPLRLALLRAVGHYSVGGPASGDRVLSRCDFVHAGHCSRRAGLSPARPRRVFRTSCLLRLLLSDEGRSRSLRRQILRSWLEGGCRGQFGLGACSGLGRFRT
jgi:hypothetical protein